MVALVDSHSRPWPLVRTTGCLNLLLAVLVAAGCSVGAGAARAGPSSTAAMAGISGGGRQQLHRASARALLQQTCICPATDAAKTSCQQGTQTEKDNLLRAVVQYCTRLGFAPTACCPNMPISDPKWQLWSACLCAQDNASLTAFVDGPRIVQTCGCGGNWGVTGSPAMAQASASAIVGSIVSASGSTSTSGGNTATGGITGTGGGTGTSPSQVVADLAASYTAAGLEPPLTGSSNASGQQPAGTTAAATATVGTSSSGHG